MTNKDPFSKDIKDFARDSNMNKIYKGQQKENVKNLFTKEKSKRPIKPLAKTESVDPVYNVVNQNDTAKPGFGYTPIPPQRYDLAHIRGHITRTSELAKPVMCKSDPDKHAVLGGINVF
jgi:hypothetical protein